ncbi:rhodanese-like domain-containing protein [Clostridium sp. AM58-1XD]|uniref:rhodanese-like domain-containing protein n=1 Tax=Clostridium sp. AM58-1XD TaxID=2292307 RepID=UPI000E474ABC|nr:rhodanese-like domain-containing protein [Clostridium sp. AM58-1XD]RGZ01294.1 rhodanese-like domain-containing protein [Clostridium sp. AM58-1XD]
MKKHILSGLVLSCIFLLSACSAPGGKSPADQNAAPTSASAEAVESAYHKITAEEAKEMIDKGDVTIVDVRTADEYKDAHIPGAVLVPNESIGSELPEALPDTDAVLLVHCRTGIRSRQASDKLVELGYTQVYDFGGIVDWPYETESGEAE